MNLRPHGSAASIVSRRQITTVQTDVFSATDKPGIRRPTYLTRHSHTSTGKCSTRLRPTPTRCHRKIAIFLTSNQAQHDPVRARPHMHVLGSYRLRLCRLTSGYDADALSDSDALNRL